MPDGDPFLIIDDRHDPTIPVVIPCPPTTTRELVSCMLSGTARSIRFELVPAMMPATLIRSVVARQAVPPPFPLIIAVVMRHAFRHHEGTEVPWVAGVHDHFTSADVPSVIMSIRRGRYPGSAL